VWVFVFTKPTRRHIAEDDLKPYMFQIGYLTTLYLLKLYRVDICMFSDYGVFSGMGIGLDGSFESRSPFVQQDLGQKPGHCCGKYAHTLLHM
jgi:hypothetical protein